MQKLLLSSALVAVIGLIPNAQAATSGTINFTGTVVADSCQITVAGGNATGTVALPTVQTSQLATQGATAGDTPFDITLSGCDANLAGAQVAFSGANVNTTNGNLDNAAVDGSDVQIQLVNAGAVVNTADNSNAPTISVSNGAGSVSLTARYYAVNADTTPGRVSTSVNFTLTYL